MVVNDESQRTKVIVIEQLVLDDHHGSTRARKLLTKDFDVKYFA
jgi:hypothetical protein